MSKPPVTMTRLEKINLDDSPQARVKDDETKVDEYAASLEAGEELPPVDLYREMLPEPNPLKDYILLIGDGFKRVKAHLKVKGIIGLINARIWEEGREGAIKHACRANTTKQHGVVRTQADARNAVKMYLTSFDWWKHSDREVGRQCEVDHKTVATIREKLEEDGTIPNAQQRLGLDKKTRELPKKEELGNSPVEEKPSLLIASPAQSSAGVMATFNQAEKRLEDLGLLTPPEASKPTPETVLPSELSSQDTTSIDDKSKGDTKPRLHKLLGDLEKEYSARGWSAWVLLDKSPKKMLSLTQALTLLPDAEVGCRTDFDIDTGARFIFRDALMNERLCVFESYPPKKEEPTPTTLQKPVQSEPPKAQAKASEEGAASAAPSSKYSGNGHQHYNTPPQLAEPLAKVDECGLDPCHNGGSILNAYVKITEAEDGLDDGWNWALLAKGNLIIVNPPYNNITPWADRCAKEAARGASLVLIVPNRSDTDWHQAASRSCKLRVEIRGRVHFLKDGVPDKSPQEATVIFYWGSDPGRFAAVFSQLGVIIHEVPSDLFAGSLATLREEALEERQMGLPLVATPETQAALPKEEMKRCIIGDCKKPREVDLFYCASHRFFNEQKPGRYQTRCSVKDCPRYAWMCGDCVEHYCLPAMTEMLVQKQQGKELRPACGCHCPDCKEDGQETFVSETEMEAHTCEGWLVWFNKAQLLLPSPKAKEETVGEPTIALKEKTEEKGEPEIWLPLALAKLRACTTWQEFDALYKKIAADASDTEVLALVNHHDELRAKLPSADNVKPQDLVKKEEPKKEETKEPESYCFEVSLTEGLKPITKGGWSLFDREVREIDLSPKQYESWKKDDRIKWRDSNWEAKIPEKFKACAELDAALKVYDTLVEECVEPGDSDTVRKALSAWKASQAQSSAPKKTAPAPQRKKGKDETPLKKKNQPLPPSKNKKKVSKR